MKNNVFRIQYWQTGLDIFDLTKQPTLVGHRATLPEAKRLADEFLKHLDAHWEGKWATNRGRNWCHTRHFWPPDVEDSCVMVILPSRAGGLE